MAGDVVERDIWEVANQLEGYVGPDTPDDLATFLLREGKAAAALATEIETLRARLAELEAGHAGGGVACPGDIRALGWSVAVHNDYRLNGEAHTFWLFTKDGRAVKGEGRTDAEALNAIRAALAAPSPSAGEPVRCLVTGNPVGTDTVQVGYQCPCTNCTPPATPVQPTASVEAVADEIERELFAWRGANGGVFTLRAASVAIAQKIASLTPAPAQGGGR